MQQTSKFRTVSVPALSKAAAGWREEDAQGDKASCGWLACAEGRSAFTLTLCSALQSSSTRRRRSKALCHYRIIHHHLYLPVSVARGSPLSPYPCLRLFYKRQESLINDRSTLDSSAAGGTHLFSSPAGFLCPCHVLRCDHRVMGAFVWLTGIYVVVGCDMTILGPVPSWSNNEPSELEQLQYETYDNATVRAHARNSTHESILPLGRAVAAQ
jgi:hypothetical protein